MCAGSAAHKSQVKQYERNLRAREVKWAGARNVWQSKLARYQTERAENVLAHSRKIGAIQRNFGLEKARFLKDNEDAYRKLAVTAFVDEGNRARGAGRNAELKGLYGEAARMSNLRRAGVSRDVQMRGANRQLISMQNRALTRRGLAPIPGVAPAAPVGKGLLEFGFDTGMALLGAASSYKSVFHA